MSSLPSDSRYPCRSRHMERGGAVGVCVFVVEMETPRCSSIIPRRWLDRAFGLRACLFVGTHALGHQMSAHVNLCFQLLSHTKMKHGLHKTDVNEALNMIMYG